MPELPSGTVTFLFTDVEGSTRRWERDSPAMLAAVERHFELLRQAIEANHGRLFKKIGDAAQAAFPTAPDAVAAALAAQQALLAEEWSELGPLRVRMALHAGVAAPQDGDYLAPPLNRLARLLATGHGGQVLLSQAVQNLTRETLPPGATLRDLGEHRLRDLYLPERIAQLLHPSLPADFPPVKTLANRPNNLPVQPTPFLGREQWVDQVVDRLRQSDRPEGTRLLTLTGPAGVGKTRLALQTGADLLDAFPDGVWFVDLSPVADPALLPATVAAALSVREDGDRPLIAALREHLRTRSLLLILDNFEHIAEHASLVADLLAAAPGLRVLATSRTPLRLRGERELAVPPMAVPERFEVAGHAVTPAHLTQYEAVRLFVARAQDVKADFAITNETAPLVAEICARLDGLPLAIELAAARVKLLPLPALLSRLDSRLHVLTSGPRDAPTRQRTLRDAIAWSFDLLTPEEQTLFRRLGLFAGGATLDAIETIANHDGTVDVFGGIEALVDDSLLRPEAGPDGEPRYAMLQTIREYALDRLAAQGEVETGREAHAAYFTALATAAGMADADAAQPERLDRLASEHDNLRAALGWWSEGRDAEQGLCLAATMSPFWWIRGHLSEGRAWLERLLASGAGEPATRARALRASGILAETQGDLARAAACYEEALAISRSLDDRYGIAKSIESLGGIARDQADYARATGLLDEALALCRAVDDRRGVAHGLLNLGGVAFLQGEPALASSRYAEALALLRALGDRPAIAATLNDLGTLALRQGELERASQSYEEALALHRALGDKHGIALVLGGLGELAQLQNDLDRATARYGEALPLFQELGDKRNIAATLASLGEVEQARGNLAGAGTLLANSLTLAREIGDNEAIARRLELLAGLATDQALPDPGARLFGAAAALREAIGAPLPPVYRADYDRRLAATRAALGDEPFATALASGRDLPLEQAVAAALALTTGAPREAPLAVPVAG